MEFCIKNVYNLSNAQIKILLKNYDSLPSFEKNILNAVIDKFKLSDVNRYKNLSRYIDAALDENKSTQETKIESIEDSAPLYINNSNFYTFSTPIFVEKCINENSISINNNSETIKTENTNSINENDNSDKKQSWLKIKPISELIDNNKLTNYNNNFHTNSSSEYKCNKTKKKSNFYLDNSDIIQISGFNKDGYSNIDYSVLNSKNNKLKTAYDNYIDSVNVFLKYNEEINSAEIEIDDLLDEISTKQSNIKDLETFTDDYLKKCENFIKQNNSKLNSSSDKTKTEKSVLNPFQVFTKACESYKLTTENNNSDNFNSSFLNECNNLKNIFSKKTKSKKRNRENKNDENTSKNPNTYWMDYVFGKKLPKINNSIKIVEESPTSPTLEIKSKRKRKRKRKDIDGNFVKKVCTEENNEQSSNTNPEHKFTSDNKTVEKQTSEEKNEILILDDITLTESDLKVLLKFFYKLEKQEQLHLMKYLEELEVIEPDRVADLRKNIRLTPPERKENGFKTNNLQESNKSETNSESDLDLSNIDLILEDIEDLLEESDEQVNFLNQRSPPFLWRTRHFP